MRPNFQYSSQKDLIQKSLTVAPLEIEKEINLSPQTVINKNKTKINFKPVSLDTQISDNSFAKDKLQKSASSVNPFLMAKARATLEKNKDILSRPF